MPLEWDWLQPFETIFTQIADFEAALRDDRLGMGMSLERAELETPIEIHAGVEDDGRVSLTSAPPTQHVETTYMPVFHKLRLVVTADAGG